MNRLTDMNENFGAKLREYADKVNETLYSLSYLKALDSIEDRVIEAENYALSAGGKRIRAILCLEFYKLFGGKDDIREIACCLELIHTFSLIHDDMPEMDNDDFRRGKPSTHKAYGDDIALLAGDGLAILPFEIISNHALCEKISFEKAAKLVDLLASSAGNRGMIAGQVLDLNSEMKNVDESYLIKMSQLKTGRLLVASCLFGAVLADATESQIDDVRTYAENVGLAFQMIDDVLDVTGTQDVLGKPIGSDSKRDKNTFVDIYGIDHTLRKANDLTQSAVDAIEKYSGCEFLVELARYLTERNS